MSWIVKTCVWMGAATVVGGLAVAVKLNHLETGVVSTGKTEVAFNITVRGTGGRAVKNAILSVYDPDQVILGKTNNEGLLNIKASLSSGRSLILQAEGVAFKMQRTILVPRSVSYNASIFFDLAEVHEGNATLISTENSETTALEKVPTPTPVVLRFDGSMLQLSNDGRTALAKLLNETALKINMIKNSTVACRSWDGTTALFECEYLLNGSRTSSRLFQSLPTSSQSAEAFLNAFSEVIDAPKTKKLGLNEILFAVKHNGGNFRIYMDSMPLTLWREKNETSFFRGTVRNTPEGKATVNLTLITDHGQILQRKISWPNAKRVFTVRIPASNRIDLSRREQGSSIPR